MKNYSKLFLTAIMILTALASVKAGIPANDNLANAQVLGNALSGTVSGSNVSATKEPDEPSHYTANPNIQSVWYKWTAPSTRSMAFEITEDFAAAMAIYTSNQPNPTFAQLTKIQSNSDILGYQYTGCRINFMAQSGKTYYIVVDFGNAGGPGNQTGAFELKFKPNALKYSTHFEPRDQRASVGVYRPSNSVWYYRFSAYGGFDNQHLYGLAGDQPVPADYNGDGKTDFTMVRNENGHKIWYTQLISTVYWGLPGDRILAGDFDDDGRADQTAVRSNGQHLIWYALRSSDAKMAAIQWGIPTDNLVVGDFDGDRITDPTVTRITPDGGLLWYILRSNGGAFDQYTPLQFGLEGDVVATEDFDGDGKSDIAVFRPSTGTWYIVNSGNVEVQIKQFGLYGDKPQAADYDLDGKADLAVFRPSTGDWFIQMSGSGTVKSLHYGIDTDMPIISMNTLLQD